MPAMSYCNFISKCHDSLKNRHQNIVSFVLCFRIEFIDAGETTKPKGRGDALHGCVNANYELYFRESTIAGKGKGRKAAENRQVEGGEES